MENRNDLIVDAFVTQADGHAERNAALAMIERVVVRTRSRWVPTKPLTHRTSSTRHGP